MVSRANDLAKTHAHFAAMLHTDGYYGVHIAQQLDKPCPVCTGQEPSPHCPACLGLGYRVRLKPILMRKAAPSRPDKDATQEEPMGKELDIGNGVYCEPDAKPSFGDIIVTVAWSVPTELVITRGVPVAVHQFFKVEDVVPYHAEGAVLAYYRLGVHATIVNIDQFRAAVLACPYL